jgi:hypothetical protein
LLGLGAVNNEQLAQKLANLLKNNGSTQEVETKDSPIYGSKDKTLRMRKSATPPEDSGMKVAIAYSKKVADDNPPDLSNYMWYFRWRFGSSLPPLGYMNFSPSSHAYERPSIDGYCDFLGASGNIARGLVLDGTSSASQGDGPPYSWYPIYTQFYDPFQNIHGTDVSFAVLDKDPDIGAVGPIISGGLMGTAFGHEAFHETNTTISGDVQAFAMGENPITDYEIQPSTTHKREFWIGGDRFPLKLPIEANANDAYAMLLTPMKNTHKLAVSIRLGMYDRLTPVAFLRNELWTLNPVRTYGHLVTYVVSGNKIEKEFFGNNWAEIGEPEKQWRGFEMNVSNRAPNHFVQPDFFVFEAHYRYGSNFPTNVENIPIGGEESFWRPRLYFQRARFMTDERLQIEQNDYMSSYFYNRSHHFCKITTKEGKTKVVAYSHNVDDLKAIADFNSFLQKIKHSNAELTVDRYEPSVLPEVAEIAQRMLVTNDTPPNYPYVTVYNEYLAARDPQIIRNNKKMFRVNVRSLKILPEEADTVEIKDVVPYPA